MPSQHDTCCSFACSDALAYSAIKSASLYDKSDFNTVVHKREFLISIHFAKLYQNVPMTFQLLIDKKYNRIDRKVNYLEGHCFQSQTFYHL